MKDLFLFGKHMKIQWLLCSFILLMACSSDDDTTSPPDPDPATNTLTANAGPDQNFTVLNQVILDGSGSTDSDGNTFDYLWSFVSIPAGSAATLEDAATVAPSFTSDVNGVYEIQLKISNAKFESVDNVTITVNAGTPTTTIELGGTIREDLVLENIVDIPGVADYCITSNISLEAVMTIMPGVEIHFEPDLEFLVRGDEAALIAKGTAEDRIVFTAKDSSKPWRGIAFVLADDFRNALDYVDISYAGVDKISIVDRIAALGASSFSKFSFTNSSITNSASLGMYVADDVELTDFANNRFENNATLPLVLPADQIGQLDAASQFSLSNGENVIEIHEGIVDLDAATTWVSFDDKTPYYVTDDIDIVSQVNIKEGVNLLFDISKVFRVDDPGILIAEGTAENPIIFTAKDSSLPWNGIGILSSSIQNRIDHAEISYAGADKISILSRKAAIGVKSFEKFSLTNTKITNSVSNGMLIEGDVEIINFGNNSFENNAEVPLVVSAESLHQLDTTSQFGTTNGKDYIEVEGAVVDYDMEIDWTAFTDGTPYLLSSNLSISSGVNVMPNVKMMIGSNLSIRVDSTGFFSAKGGSDDGRIVFTAFDQALPWQGISFLTDDVRNELDFVEVSYAGSDELGNIAQVANIGVGAFDRLKLTNSIISNGLGYGISVGFDAEVNMDVESTNVFSNNTLGILFQDM